MRQIGIGNTGIASGIFDFRIVTDRFFTPHVASDVSQMISGVKLTLSAAAYNSWVVNGSMGNHTSSDEGTRSIEFSSVSDVMSIKGISLAAGQKDVIKLELTANPLSDTFEMAPITINFQQQEAGNEEIYGNVSFRLHTQSIYSGGSSAKQVQPTQVVTMAKEDLEAYPNPSKGTFGIFGSQNLGIAKVVIQDLLGHIVLTTIHDFSRGRASIDLSDSPSGMYIAKVQPQNGTAYVLKLTKY